MAFTKVTKEEILRMSRDEIINFLIENWSLAKELPPTRAYNYFASRPDDFPMEVLQHFAYDAIGQ